MCMHIVILAPATANIIGKLANGIADDMLSTILLATQAAVYIAPAMNVHMYAHPAVSLRDWMLVLALSAIPTVLFGFTKK